MEKNNFWEKVLESDETNMKMYGQHSKNMTEIEIFKLKKNLTARMVTVGSYRGFVSVPPNSSTLPQMNS